MDSGVLNREGFTSKIEESCRTANTWLKGVCATPHSGEEEDADVALWLLKGPSGPPVWDQLRGWTETKLMIRVWERNRNSEPTLTIWSQRFGAWTKPPQEGSTPSLWLTHKTNSCVWSTAKGNTDNHQTLAGKSDCCWDPLDFTSTSFSQFLWRCRNPKGKKQVSILW